MKRLTLYRIASSLLLPIFARNQPIGEEAEFIKVEGAVKNI
jgi:hypothetical protein